jgi:hypothetical protein
MRSNRPGLQIARHLLSALLPAAIGFVVASSASAQPPSPGSGLPSPRLFTIVPPGGQQSQVVDVTFTGTDLEEPERLIFSNPGITAEPVIPPAPPADPKKPAPASPPKPVITTFRVRISPRTPLGNHDVRLVNKWGVSNPRAFVVGDLPEVMDKEPNNDVEQAQRISLNVTVNGNVTNQVDVDYYVFSGKAGQRVVVSCLASSIDSRLQPGLELYDKAGRQVAFNRKYDGTDALVDYTLPADGDYLIRVFEFTYTRGSPEHFYRLTVSTAPWIDAMIPPVLEPGKPTRVVVYGRNLPGGILDPSAQVEGRALEKLLVTVTAPSDPAHAQQLAYSGVITPSAAALDGFEYRLRNSAGSSNPYLLSYARAAVVYDNGDNDTAEKAQEVSLPSEIAGRIEKIQDRDYYSFQAKAGEVWIIELLGERIGATADLYAVVRNTATKQDMAEIDDTPDTLHPFKFVTRTTDPPRYRFTAPAEGKYQLLISSREANANAGPKHSYVVRIFRDQPDFRLFVLPSDDFRPDACQVPKNGEQFFHVLAWRFDTFAGPITVSAEGLPEGVTFTPATIAANMRQVPLVLSATPAVAGGVYEVRIKGTAMINGQPVVREARAAHITWPGIPGGNIPVISRLARSTVLSVRDQPPYRVLTALEKPNLLQGEKTNLKVTLTRLSADFKTPLQAIAIDLPPNLLTVNNNQPITIAPGKTEATAVVEAKANLPPGTYTIVMRATAQMPYNKDPMAKQKPNVNLVQPSTAVTISVLPKQVATLSVPNANVTAKVGMQSEVPIKLTRMFNYAGEFKVQVVLPQGVKGLSVEEVTVPAGQDEAKLVVRVASDMAPANLANLVVRATAMQEGNITTVHEAKLNINVVK